MPARRAAWEVTLPICGIPEVAPGESPRTPVVERAAGGDAIAGTVSRLAGSQGVTTGGVEGAGVTMIVAMATVVRSPNAAVVLVALMTTARRLIRRQEMSGRREKPARSLLLGAPRYGVVTMPVAPPARAAVEPWWMKTLGKSGPAERAAAAASVAVVTAAKGKTRPAAVGVRTAAVLAVSRGTRSKRLP